VKKIYRQLAIVYLTFYLILVICFFLGSLKFNLIQSSVYGGIINLINSVAAIIAFNHGFEKSNKIFLIYILGGIAFRLLFTLILIFLSLKYLNIDKLGFIFTLVILYFTNLILEINYFRLKIAVKKN
jgi:F0F1-type ATP synthase assembly protein I